MKGRQSITYFYARFLSRLSFGAIFYLQAAFSKERRRFRKYKGESIIKTMDTRVAVLGIIVENTDSTESLNALLHEYGNYIIGRMGIPYRERRINIISIAIDAPQDIIATLSGKIGKLSGVSVKTAYSNVITHE